MTIHTSQGTSASAHADTDIGLNTEGHTVPEIIPEQDPWLIRASIRAFGPCSTRALDRPLPDITDTLAARILRVSHAIEHAGENGQLKWAPELVKADSIYNDAIKECLTGLKQRNSSLYYKISEEFQQKPKDLEAVKNRLSREFDLFAKGISGQRYFHFRNNIAYLYEQANRIESGPSLF